MKYYKVDYTNQVIIIVHPFAHYHFFQMEIVTDENSISEMEDGLMKIVLLKWKLN